MAVFTSDFREIKFGKLHAAFSQKSFTGELPLVGLYGTHKDAKGPISSIGFITLDTINCPLTEEATD